MLCLKMLYKTKYLHVIFIINAPVACTSCINNTHKEFTKGVEVIKSMVDCAINDVNQLKKDVQKILHDRTTDSKTRQAMEKMNSYITKVLSHRGGWIKETISSGDFKGASKTINEVVTKDLIICSKIISGSGITIPPPVFSGLFSAESDFKLSKQLIDKGDLFDNL